MTLRLASGPGAAAAPVVGLAVALEFALAADIRRTAVAPTWTEIGQLAAIPIPHTPVRRAPSRCRRDRATDRDRRPATPLRDLPEDGERGSARIN